jgi:hypothetical protein
LKSLGLLKTAGIVAGAITLSNVVWNGSDTIQGAITFIKSANEKVISANSNIVALKEDIKGKYEQLLILKSEIDELNYEIELYGEIGNLNIQLEQKTAQYNELNEKYKKLIEETETDDYKELVGQLESAENDVERLRLAMEGSSIESTDIDSDEELEAFLNEKYIQNIEFNYSTTYKKYIEEFIKSYGIKIAEYLQDNGIWAKDVSIEVSYWSSASTYILEINTITEYKKEKIKDVCTKTKIKKNCGITKGLMVYVDGSYNE